jgi:hypothetical protein
MPVVALSDAPAAYCDAATSPFEGGFAPFVDLICEASPEADPLVVPTGGFVSAEGFVALLQAVATIASASAHTAMHANHR